MARDPKEKPLTVRVKSGVLTIEIGVETLAHAALRSQWAYALMGPKQERPDTRFRISGTTAFAREVSDALTAEAEDGSSLLTELLDKATENAVDDGSLYFIDKENH